MGEPGPNSNRLENPFASKVGDNFIGFSSSTPSHVADGQRGGPSNRRGQNYRSKPWERFNDFSDERQHPPQRGRGPGNFSNHTPRFYSPQNVRHPYRGNQSFYGHQGHRGSPNFHHRSPYNFRGQDNFRRHSRGHNPSREGFGGSTRSFFHPAMLEDPWADLINKRDSLLCTSTDASSISDSLRVNTSFLPMDSSSSTINPAPDVQEYESEGDDEGPVPSPVEQTCS